MNLDVDGVDDGIKDGANDGVEEDVAAGDVERLLVEGEGVCVGRATNPKL